MIILVKIHASYFYNYVRESLSVWKGRVKLSPNRARILILLLKYIVDIFLITSTMFIKILEIYSVVINTRGLIESIDTTWFDTVIKQSLITLSKYR